MTDAVRKAIAESRLRDKIVTMDGASQEDIESLKRASSDWVEAYGAVEAWGLDWRVHAYPEEAHHGHGPM